MGNKMLIKANIINNQSYCYISDDNMIFTPIYDKNNIIIKTGEEVYKEWLANRENVSE